MNLKKELLFLFIVGILIVAICGVINYFQEDKIEEKNEVEIIYKTKCFQRILGWDRTWDIENNFISGSYWNTTWHETICGEYDNYKLMNYELRDVKYEDFKKEEKKE